MRGRVDGVAKGRVCRLYGEVPQHGGLGLDGVALLVVIGHVEELQVEAGPLADDTLSVDAAHVDHHILQGQGAAGVGTLGQIEIKHGRDVRFSMVAGGVKGRGIDRQEW